MKQANGPSKVANKSGDKATTKSNTKLPKTRHNKMGANCLGNGTATGERRSEFELHIYAVKRNGWQSLVFVGAASLLSTVREKTRETDCMRESALVFSLSGASIAYNNVIAALSGIQTNSVCLCCAQRTLNSSSWLCKFQKQIVQLTGWATVTAKATTTNNTKQCRAQAVHCTALQQGKGSLN